MKKSDTLTFIFAIALGISVLIAFFQYQYTDELEAQLAARDSLLINIYNDDSVRNASGREYSKVIDKYIYDCKVTVDGKVVPTADLIEFLKETIDERDSLLIATAKSISMLRAQMELLSDSASIYAGVAHEVSKTYGIRYNVQRKGDGFVIYKDGIGKVDSALALLPFYRDRLERDSVKDRWIITIDPKLRKKP